MKEVKTEEISLKQLKHVANARLRDTDDVSDLMNDIKSRGQLSPIWVRVKDNALIAGNRRVKAFYNLGLTKIKATFFDDVNDDDLIVLNLIENLKRKGISPIEVGRMCNMLKERSEMTLGELSARLGMTKSKVEACLAAYKRTVGTPFEKLITYGEIGRNKFGIPASLIWKIETSLTRAKRLTKSDWDILLHAVEERNLTVEHITMLRKILMMDRNLSITRALDMLGKCKMVRVFFHINSRELVKEMKNQKFDNEVEFFKQIVNKYNKNLLY